jgi:hypothetical protein
MGDEVVARCFATFIFLVLVCVRPALLSVRYRHHGRRCGIVMREIAALQRPPAAAADTIANKWASVLNRLGHGRTKSPRTARP